MATPKLALIPTTQGGKLYSILPSSGEGDFTFSRSGSATRINSQGLIETVADGVSRLNYPLIDGKVVGCPHHLLEPSRTNLLEYSENFNTNYLISNLNVYNDSNISPSGVLNGSKLEIINSTSAGFILNDSSLTSGLTYTQTVYAKAGTYGYLQIAGSTGFSSSNFQNYDLVNGVLANKSGTTFEASIEDVGNGWYRCTYTDNAIATGAGRFVLAVSGLSSRLTSAGVNSGDSIYLWGTMLEQGSFPTSYIPTNGSAVTRSAETANGSGDVDTFNDSEGVLMVEISALADDSNIEGISISDGSSSNRVVFFKWNSSNSIRARVTSSGVNTLNQTITISDVTTLNKIAIKYKLNDFAIWINGIKLFTDTSGSTPIGLNELNFNSDGIGGAPFYANTKQIQYFDSALTDSELETLTSWVSFSDMANGQLYTIQ